MPVPRISKSKAKTLAKAQRVAAECKVRVVEAKAPEPTIIPAGTSLVAMKGEPCVEIKDCEYGKGVFATRDIRKGEIITHYGGHVYDDKYDEIVTSPVELSVDELDDILVDRAEYTVGTEFDGVRYCVDGREAPRDDPMMCGHLFNDPGNWDFETDEHWKTIMKEYDRVWEQQKSGVPVTPAGLTIYLASFCCHKQASLVDQNSFPTNLARDTEGNYYYPMKASRDIKAGEQIYYFYGTPYWIGKELIRSGRSMKPWGCWRKAMGNGWVNILPGGPVFDRASYEEKRRVVSLASFIGMANKGDLVDYLGKQIVLPLLLDVYFDFVDTKTRSKLMKRIDLSNKGCVRRVSA